MQDSQSSSEFSLENGLKIYLLPYSRSPLATLVLAVRAGVVEETPRTNGFSHLLEHCLLFRQSHLNQEDRLFRTIKKYGLYYNAHTEQDLMFFELSLLSEHLGKGLELLKEVVFSFNLTEEALEKEKIVLLKELAETARQPEKVGLARIYELAFPGLGYGLPVYGQEAVIRQASLAELKDWHQRHFRPNRAALVVVGQFDRSRLQDEIKSLFSELQPGPEPVRPSTPSGSSLESGAMVEIKMKVSDTYLLAGLLAPEYNHPDRLPMDMLSEIVGQGLNPLIYQAFAGQADLITSARFHYLSYEQAGLLFISITTGADKVSTTRRLLQKFLPQLSEINYSQKDYLPGQQWLVFDFLQGGKSRFEWLAEKMMESPLLLGLSLGKHLLLGEPGRPQNYLEAIKTLDSSDLRKVARKYLARARAVWVVIKPE
ncbi:MAG: M16 family metallopeptidase [Candidatus Saccharicenans sp.]|uniref:M16 family metallopeptidase n=1 Tax=Candidatus Saccharicenans sp. TaxID=2819258 RepID=UPI00404A7DE3